MSFNNHANKPDDQAAAGSDSKLQFPMSDDFYDVINMTPPLMNTKMNHEYYSSNGNLNSLDHIDTMDTGHNLLNQVQGTLFDGYDNVRINSASSSNSSNFPNQFEIAMDSSFIPQQHQHQDQLQQQQRQLQQHQHQQLQQQQQASQYIHPDYGQSNKGSITSPDLLSPVSNLKSQTSNTTLSPHASNGYNLSIPRSPGAYSTHSSAFSDGSVNHPDSPYVDAASQFSNANPPSFNNYTDGSQIQNNQDQQFIQNDQFPESLQYLQNQQAFQNHQQLNSNFQGLPNQFLDPDPSNLLNTFDSEIALGGSISSTNLVSMDEPNSYNIGQRLEIPQFNYSINNQPMTDFHMGTQLVVTPPTESTAPNKLTENNLLNYTNSIQQHPSQDASFLSKEIIISIQLAPEEIAAKTPSLFSNSSANSSIHNSPAQGTGQANELSRQNTGNALSVDHYKLQKQQEYSGNSLIPNSQLVNTQQTTTLLKPDEFQSMRRGRRKSHSASSRNSSKSPNRLGRSNEEDDFYGDEDEDEDDDEDFEDEYEAEGDDGYLAPRQKLSSRQKMLELASPTQSTKKTQKHPSVYACHLCEKRFTRPYNLKSHLRTHTDERPFICNVCGKAFARQHDRKRHEELHTGEKKFQCKGFLRDGTEYGCSRKFARADALRRHFQTDNGKACIMLLIEEEKREKIQSDGNPNNLTNSKNANDFLMLNNMSHHHQKGKIPKVAISPPD